MVRPRPFYPAIVLCAVLALPAWAEQQGVNWQQDLEAAKAAAKASGRLVLVHFWTEQCGPCVMLDRNVFSQPGVAGAIESRFVPVKLNANENPGTATQFGITRVPTDVIITPDGQIVGKLISPPTPSAYIAEVTQAANQYASRSGGAFADAVAGAPMPSQLNAAYAKLPVNPATPPAVPAGLIAPPSLPPQDTFSVGPATAAAGAASVGAPPTTFAPQLSAAPNSYQTPFASSQTFAPSNSVFGAPPAPGGVATPGHTTPAIQAAPAAANRYAQMPGTELGPPANVPPMQPYVPPSIPPTAPQQSPAVVPFAPATTAPTEPAVAQPWAPPFAAAAAPQIPTIAAPSAAIESTTVPAIQAPAAPVAQSTVTQSTLPAGAPPVGFEGFCTVSMRTHWKWVPGDSRWGAVHRGRTYLFAGQNEQQQFLQNPDYYAPALSGVDAVLAVEHRQVVLGRREHSIDYDNQIYLFASEATLQQFTANPERYAASVRQAMGIERGRLVR